jgi:hypothetical protein
MEIAYIQIWQEYTKDEDPIIIGASLHKNEESCINYIESKYKTRNTKSVPKKYISILGKYTKCMVTKHMFYEIEHKDFVFVRDHQLYNLVMFNKLIELDE